MRKLRHRPAKRMVDRHLFRRVGKMVVAANHMRNPHQRIVDRHHVVVHRHASGADQDRVGHGFSGKLHSTTNNIVKQNRIGPDFQTHCKRLSAVRASSAFFRRNISAPPGVELRLVCGNGLCPLGIELLRGTEAAIGVAFSQQTLRVRPINLQSFRLPIRSVRPVALVLAGAGLWAFVPIQTQPA